MPAESCKSAASGRSASSSTDGPPSARIVKQGRQHRAGAVDVGQGLRDHRRPHERRAADEACQQLAADHADATLLENAAGLFLPKPFLDHDGADYDSYQELNRAIFFLTQTVAKGMVGHGQGGSIVNIGSMWANQAIGATPSSAYSLAKGGLHALQNWRRPASSHQSA